VRSELPLDGFEERFPGAYVVACVDEAIVGVAGLEQYGDAGLLRSVAVDRSVQGSGVGRSLVDDRVRRARELALDRVILLTTTAAPYFRVLGFEPSAVCGRVPRLRGVPEPPALTISCVHSQDVPSVGIGGQNDDS